MHIQSRISDFQAIYWFVRRYKHDCRIWGYIFLGMCTDFVIYQTKVKTCINISLQRYLLKKFSVQLRRARVFQWRHRRLFKIIISATLKWKIYLRYCANIRSKDVATLIPLITRLSGLPYVIKPGIRLKMQNPLFKSIMWSLSVSFPKLRRKLATQKVIYLILQELHPRLFWLNEMTAAWSSVPFE